MESTLLNRAFVAANTAVKAKTIVYWMVTTLLPADELHRLRATAPAAGGGGIHPPPGLPACFRVELPWAKLIGVVLMLAPVPARLKEWAYAGFAINLASALIAHLAAGDGPEAWGWAAATGALSGLSYFLWIRLEAPAAGAPRPGAARAEASALRKGAGYAACS